MSSKENLNTFSITVRTERNSEAVSEISVNPFMFTTTEQPAALHKSVGWLRGRALLVTVLVVGLVAPV